MALGDDQVVCRALGAMAERGTGMTAGYLIESIGYMLAKIQERWPDRVSRSDGERLALPGTYITVREDQCIWIGDHYDWDMWTVEDLQRVRKALDSAVTSLEVA